MPVTNLVIKAMVNMAEDNKIKTIKFEKSQECYYILIIGWQECIMKIRTEIKGKI